VLDNSESDEDKRVIKRRKKGNNNENPNNLEFNSTDVTNSLTSFDSRCTSSIEIIGDSIIEK